jgi:hypothetical protein
MELKRNIFLGVAVVIDVYFIHRLGIERKEIWAAVRRLKRQIARDERHEIGPAWFVTVK